MRITLFPALLLPLGRLAQAPTAVVTEALPVVAPVVEQAPTEPAKVKWVTLAEAQEAVKKDPKPILIDVYTEWCGPCKMLSAKTFTDPQTVALMNKNFHCVKFNAEGPDPVKFKGQDFSNPDHVKGQQGRNGTHQLARALGVSAYPTVMYLDSDLNAITLGTRLCNARTDRAHPHLLRRRRLQDQGLGGVPARVQEPPRSALSHVINDQWQGPDKGPFA
ncbi:MAG: thioredoxin family protein [Flavobacteriales bacterium]|nr:thioredoxin family protein [Flavobacteriales bacterium]